MDLNELPTLLYHKFKYVITLLDDCSSYAVLIKLRRKSDAFQAFKDYKSWAEKQSGRKIKKIHIDRGGEFLNEITELFLKAEGIEVQKSEPHVHQQNGCTEHINHTLMDKSESMRQHTCCLESWWEFSYSTAMHVYNRTPMCRLNWKTPTEIFTRRKPDVSYFRTFGAGAYVFIPKGQCKSKQSAHSEAMIFIEYDQGSKGYIFM